MKTKHYEAPQAEIIRINAEDIITSSNVISNYTLNHGGSNTGAVNFNSLK